MSVAAVQATFARLHAPALFSRWWHVMLHSAVCESHQLHHHESNLARQCACRQSISVHPSHHQTSNLQCLYQCSMCDASSALPKVSCQLQVGYLSVVCSDWPMDHVMRPQGAACPATCRSKTMAHVMGDKSRAQKEKDHVWQVRKCCKTTTTRAKFNEAVRALACIHVLRYCEPVTIQPK
jgi:hypothetical protein